MVIVDQGAVIAIDDQKPVWTPLRVVLALLGAVLGGILLSLITGGLAAHADSPDSPPPSLLGSVSAAVSTDVITPVEQHVLPAAAPVTTPVDTVLATVNPEPTAGAAAPLPPGPGTSAVSAVDGLLDRSPLVATPIWHALIGPHPLSTLLNPVGTALRATLPGLAPVIGTVSADPAGLSLAGPERTMADARVGLGAAASAVFGSAASVLSSAPDGLPPTPTAALSNGGFSRLVPASILGAFALLFLALAKARRDDGTLPSSPVYETDSSPD